VLTEDCPYAQVERRAVAPLAFEGAHVADGARLEQQPHGVGLAGEAGVVERDGVPAVARVQVGPSFDKGGEPGAVAGARRLVDVKFDTACSDPISCKLAS
jgi:hypothetical protein